MESFKEEHSDGKVFSMDIQKLKNYASKHKMKVALGTTMAVALIAGASAGTYAYFTSQATANTNLTLNKGTVTLGTYDNEVKWTYLGNSTEQDISKVSAPKDDYKGRTINPDLKSENDKKIDSTTGVFSGSAFKNIVPGDIFKKEYSIAYTGTNTAEINLKLSWGDHNSSSTESWKQFNSNYNYVVEYKIDDNDSNTTDKKVTLLSNCVASTVTSYTNLVSDSGYDLMADTNTNTKKLIKNDYKINIYITVGLKAINFNSSEQANNLLPSTIQSVGTDGFVLTVRNHLESK